MSAIRPVHGGARAGRPSIGGLFAEGPGHGGLVRRDVRACARAIKWAGLAKLEIDPLPRPDRLRFLTSASPPRH